MNKQQKVNLLCIVFVIFGGLIIVGGFKTLGSPDKHYKSIFQLEDEEKYRFDSIDKAYSIPPQEIVPKKHIAQVDGFFMWNGAMTFAEDKADREYEVRQAVVQHRTNVIILWILIAGLYFILRDKPGCVPDSDVMLDLEKFEEQRRLIHVQYENIKKSIEAEHLVEDEIILFPVTDETTAFGSLGEVGFSINQAITSNDERFVVVFVDPTVCAEIKEADPKAAKESSKARALVLAHIKKQAHKFPNVYVVDSIATMLPVATQLYKAMVAMKIARSACKY